MVGWSPVGGARAIAGGLVLPLPEREEVDERHHEPEVRDHALTPSLRVVVLAAAALFFLYFIIISVL